MMYGMRLRKPLNPISIKLYRAVAILAERLGVPLFAAEVAKKFQSYSGGRLLKMIDHDDVGMYSPALARVRSLYQSLTTMTDGRAVTGIDVFRTILQNTHGIIHAKGLEPTNEAEVRNAIFEIMKFVFHDAIREIPMGQLLKMFKPDIGVRSLMVAVEYKFAGSDMGVKKPLDEIYTDMRGYSGHYEWRTFFAVIYTTAPLVSKERLEGKFRGVIYPRAGGIRHYCAAAE
jgi:REase_DpnII-MboI